MAERMTFELNNKILLKLTLNLSLFLYIINDKQHRFKKNIVYFYVSLFNLSIVKTIFDPKLDL